MKPWKSTGRVALGGFVVAAVGFLLTRVTVVASANGDSISRFVVGELPVLTMGLGLMVFGVALSVSTYDDDYVNTVAKWCLAGTAAMLAMVGFAHLEPAVFGGQNTFEGSATLVANVLLGGAVVGTLTGLRTASTRRSRRRLTQQAARLTLLNRILRHEVLNKLNVVKGYAGLGRATDTTLLTIGRSADSIESAIDEVGALTTSAHPDERTFVRVDVRSCLRNDVETVQADHPSATFRLDGSIPNDLHVWGDRRLSTAVRHLLVNAVEHNDAPTPAVTVDVRTTGASVVVAIGDNGPGLPAEQADLLRDGTLPVYDDPSAGFGLTIARLLIEEYGGRIGVETGDDARGTTITVGLQRATAHSRPGSYGLDAGRLWTITAISLVAGVVMGLVLNALLGSLAIIGALYGLQSAPVGWLTHLTHSVVFGIAFASIVPDATNRSLPATTAAGIGFGVFLSLVAAGVVMPLWLQLVGIQAPLPNLSLAGLFGHVVWGAVLGGLWGAVGRFRR